MTGENASRRLVLSQISANSRARWSAVPSPVEQLGCVGVAGVEDEQVLQEADRRLVVADPQLGPGLDEHHPEGGSARRWRSIPRALSARGVNGEIGDLSRVAETASG